MCLLLHRSTVTLTFAIAACRSRSLAALWAMLARSRASYAKISCATATLSSTSCEWALLALLAWISQLLHPKLHISMPLLTAGSPRASCIPHPQSACPAKACALPWPHLQCHPAQEHTPLAHLPQSQCWHSTSDGLPVFLSLLLLTPTMCCCRPHLNFVSGANGSGKSASLQALQCCLGVQARKTGRAANFAELIQDGAPSGLVSVTIWNTGATLRRVQELLF